MLAWLQDCELWWGGICHDASKYYLQEDQLYAQYRGPGGGRRQREGTRLSGLYYMDKCII
jgi:hypothetical protein